MLGGPGSGKGTQSARLVDEFGLVHLRQAGAPAAAAFYAWEEQLLNLPAFGGCWPAGLASPALLAALCSSVTIDSTFSFATVRGATFRAPCAMAAAALAICCEPT